MTHFEATEAFTKICNAWPAFEPSGIDVHIWTKALKKYEFTTIDNAIQKYMETIGDRKPLLKKFCDILRTDAPAIRDETMKCDMGVGVFIQCTIPGPSGPVVGMYDEIILYHGKGVPIEHHSYIEAGQHMIDGHLTQTYPGSEWRVIEQATHADMIKARYEMRAASKSK